MLLINLAQNVEGKRINNQAATFLGGIQGDCCPIITRVAAPLLALN